MHNNNKNSPYETDACTHSGDEVMSQPPTFDSEVKEKIKLLFFKSNISIFIDSFLNGP